MLDPGNSSLGASDYNSWRGRSGELRSIRIDKSSQPLGIQISCKAKGGGVFVSSVTEGSVAAQANLRVNIVFLRKVRSRHINVKTLEQLYHDKITRVLDIIIIISAAIVTAVSCSKTRSGPQKRAPVSKMHPVKKRSSRPIKAKMPSAPPNRPSSLTKAVHSAK